MKKILLLLLIALAAGGYYYWQSSHAPNTAVGAPPGTHLATDPVQAPIVRPPIRQQGYTLSTVASYELDARVLSSQAYPQSQAGDLIPFDLALGWGPMADLKTLSGLSFTQSDRKYSWHATRLPYSANDITRYSANTHIIPATPAVRNVISQLQPGQLIALRGRLVNVTSPDGAHWNSSLSRTDTASGAGRFFYVEGAIPFNVDPTATTPGQLISSITVNHDAADATATPTPYSHTTYVHPTYANTTYVATSTNTVIYAWPSQYPPVTSTQSSAQPAPAHAPAKILLPSSASGSKISPPAPAPHRAAPAPRPAATPARLRPTTATSS